VHTLFLRIVAFALCAGCALAQTPQIGDRVRLQSTNTAGVPVHPAAGDNSFIRWANGTLGEVKAIDTATGWFKIESSSKVGWTTGKYLTVVPPDPDAPTPPSDGTEIPTAIVGTWNLEHFHDGQTRGFPENTNGGPSYGTRTASDLQRIAGIIKSQLTARILILNEINGRSGEVKSDEMDRLLAALGTGWQYALAASGNAQRIAILYDTALVRKEKCVELTFAAQDIDGKDVFEGDPLACRFTLLKAGGQTQNDFIVVGLNLASGQDKASNHNQAMRLLRLRLHSVLSDGTFPSTERDILLGGDLNASRYDNKLAFYR
jgi:hypothetical protein